MKVPSTTDSSKPYAFILSDCYFGIGNYITKSERQQEDLLQVWDKVRGYVSYQEAKRPLNIFIEASPGAGKSFLVKQLIDLIEKTLPKTKVIFKSYNITTLSSKDEITRCFRQVQDCSLSGQFPVVFFDEIDAQWPNEQFCFSYFLSPMFDGKAFESGDAFSIGRAVFFFAASKKLPDYLPNVVQKIDDNNKSVNDANQGCETYEEFIKTKRQERFELLETLKKMEKNRNSSTTKIPDKLSDFFDRMDAFIYIPPRTVKPEKTMDKSSEVLCQTQSNFIAVSMVLRRFPSVRHIEPKALFLITKSLLSAYSLRETESYIFNSASPIDSIFRFQNLPPDCILKYKKDLAKFDKAEEGGEVYSGLITIAKDPYDYIDPDFRKELIKKELTNW